MADDVILGVHSNVRKGQIDPETGRTTILRYTAAQDVGRAIHPA